jgi:hypothetical protein
MRWLFSAIGTLLILATNLFSQTPTPPANVGTSYISVTLQWDANTETDLTGYKVYWGTAPRTYGTPIVLGNQTTYSLAGFTGGAYYFSVTATSATAESGYSNEVSFLVLANPPPPTIGPMGPPGPPGPQGPAGSGACTPPCITFLGVSAITQTTASIMWVTDPECSGTVEWGPTEMLGTVGMGNILGTSDHWFLITGLIKKKHYFYRAISVCGGVGVTSPNRTFNTK